MNGIVAAHQEKIDRLRAMEPKEIREVKLAGIKEGIKSGRLTIQAVVEYTNITEEQLIRMLG